MRVVGKRTGGKDLGVRRGSRARLETFKAVARGLAGRKWPKREAQKAADKGRRSGTKRRVKRRVKDRVFPLLLRKRARKAIFELHFELREEQLGRGSRGVLEVIRG